MYNIVLFLCQLEAEKYLCVLIIALKTRFGIVNAVYDNGAWNVLNDDLLDDMQKFERRREELKA